MEKTPWYKQKTFWAGLGAGLVLAAILVCLDNRFGRNYPGMMHKDWRYSVNPYEQMDWDFDEEMMRDRNLWKGMMQPPADVLKIPAKPISSVHMESGMMMGSGQMNFNMNGASLALPYKVENDQLNLDLSQLAKYMKDNPKSKVDLVIIDHAKKPVLTVKSLTDLKNEQVQFEHKTGELYQLNLQIADENGKSMVAIEQTL